MKRLFNKCVSMILAVALIFGCVITMPNIKASAATSGTCGENLTWTLDDEGTLTISGEGKMSDWSSYSSVPWYGQKSSIKKVIIGNGVTSLGDYAFCDCKMLTCASISDSVISIGNSAFQNCDMLTDVNIPNSVISIGLWSFTGCYKLKKLNIPDSVNSMGEFAFAYCRELESVTIGNGVVSIPPYAFEFCHALTNLSIGNNVTTIGDYSFHACIKLANVTLSNSVTSIYSHAFDCCISLTTINIHRNVVSIGDYAFYDCSKLTDVYYSGSESQWNSITIFKGNSCLTDATIHYSFTRLAGSSRYDTAVAISNQGWKSADTVILANGTNYADALASVPLAYKLNAPILLTENWGDIESNVAAQIEKLGASKVIILGGYKVVSQQIEDTLSEKYTVERIKGATRYDTAVEISKRVNASPSKAIVVTGTGYADALSISPYAAMKGYPIVYTDPATGLTDSTVDYLANAQNIIIIGGYKVVRENTVAQLEGKNIDRIYGSSRYLTSYEIANRFSSEFGNDVMLATGTSFPDALTGGVLAAKLKTPLLLTEKPAVIDEIKNFILEKSPSNIYVLGGEKIMPTSIIENIYA